MSVYLECPDALPCPFCGCRKIVWHKADYEAEPYDLRCDDCGCGGPDYLETDAKLTIEEHLLMSWNTRIPPKPKE